MQTYQEPIGSKEKILHTYPTFHLLAETCEFNLEI